jgi:vacuolar-type H+-ATPase subunit I/STV1
MLTTEFVIDLSSMDPAQLERDWDQERAEKARLRAERQRKADEAEAAAARRKADDEAAQRQRDREARKKRREHIASLDRGPMIDALRLGVVQIDRRKYPRRNALDHLIENFESGGWGSVHIECPECQVRGSRLWLDDKDGSIKAQCAG